MSNLPSTLNSYWLWREISSKLRVSNPAYKYWTNTQSIKVTKNSLVQLGKLKDLELSADSTFYRLKDDYAVVVYD